MLNKQQILAIANKNPAFAQGIAALEQKLHDAPITAKGLDELIKMLEFALNHPDKYLQIRAAAIKDGMVDAEDMPEKPDGMFLVSMLAALYGLQEQKKSRGFARGGLAQAASQLRAQGRNGDSILAHITPEEALLLQRHGGSGKLNPNTGLPEFGWLSSIFKIIVPIAIAVFAPMLAPVLEPMMGAWATAGAGALLGGAGAALTGGNVLQGAVMGGMGGGLGEMIGGAANSALDAGLSTTASNALGSGIVGGLSNAAQGKNFLQGAATGATGSYLGSLVGGMGDGAVGAGMQSAGKTFGNALTAGYSPGEALTAGAASGLFSGFSWDKPSEAIVKDLQSPEPVTAPETPSPLNAIASPVTQTKLEPYVTDGPGGTAQATTAVPGAPTIPGAPEPVITPSVPEAGKAVAQDAGYQGNADKQVLYSNEGYGSTNAKSAIDKLGDWWDKKTVGDKFGMASKLMLGASMLGGGLSSAPAQVQQAVTTLTPEQKHFLDQPTVSWDWQKMQNDANRAGTSLSNYMATNWNKISAYGQPGGASAGQYAVPTIAKLAKGGALNRIAAFAQGGGDGRADTIDARLSDGEYVMDAETVALLGDGSSKAGAARLDQMREAIRAHKGKALARGQISPDAKSPLAYLKGMK